MPYDFGEVQNRCFFREVFTMDNEKKEPTDGTKDAAQPNDLDISSYFGDVIGQGYLLVIQRKTPRWCQGFCALWPLDRDFSLQDIKDCFGGKCFTLKIQRPEGGYLKSVTVWIDDEPRRNGQICDPNEDDRAERIAANRENATAGQPGQMAELLAMYRAQSDQQMAFMQKQLEIQAKANEAKTDPNALLNQNLAFFKSLKGLAAEMNPPAETDGGAKMIELFMGLMAERKAQAPRPAAAPQKRLPAPPQQRPDGPPGPIAPNPAPPTRQAGSPSQFRPPQPLPHVEQLQPEAANVEQLDEDDDDGLTLDEELATLEPEEVGAIVGQYLDGLDEDQTRRAMAALLNRDSGTVERLAVAAAPVMAPEEPQAS